MNFPIELPKQKGNTVEFLIKDINDNPYRVFFCETKSNIYLTLRSVLLEEYSITLEQPNKENSEKIGKMEVTRKCLQFSSELEKHPGYSFSLVPEKNSLRFTTQYQLPENERIIVRDTYVLDRIKNSS
ncbi:hypothetical protein M0812_12832 [Anaeramoeba flamelloides]|uniref:Uncharacterized protein n=1 Tax=Anaeramoeba flamelloides TaxID=1746091 RepID=A0AAV7ZLR5_9EUKA|nr:hypothetical protein M0812_12832 [Anaeramoeba flamelloides]